MPKSGQELLEETIDVSTKIVDNLDIHNQDWANSVNEIIAKLEEVSGTFFFKTMPSFPATRSNLKDANEVLELKMKGDWPSFEAALEKLIESSQNVLDKAGMKGTMLT